jgi:hypothetical protein
MYLHRVGDKVPPISKGAEDEQRRQVEPVVRVVQFRAPLKNRSDCDAAPYLRFFLVRNEEVVGSNPISSTKSQGELERASWQPPRSGKEKIRVIWLLRRIAVRETLVDAG